MTVTIRRYAVQDESSLFALMQREGEEWTYWQGDNRTKYRKALAESIGYLIFEGDTLCGFVRCRDDNGFGVYIYDLLVDKEYRGKEYGRLLMEWVCRDFPGDTVYVMSDVDEYYGGKLNYEREGSIFIVRGGD